MVEASVIIPTFNRAERLMTCLEALSRQTQPATDYEVVVVVDGSTDGTQEKLADLRTPFSLRVLSQPNRGQSAARNRGAGEARGKVLIFLDDDVVAAPQLVAEHLRLHHGRRDAVGVGQMALDLPPRADWFARGFARSWSEHYALLNSGARQPTWQDCYSGNMSVARAAFLEVGGFAVGLTRADDVELAYRLERHGIPFAYLPRALGTQAEQKGFIPLVGDAENSGASCVELSRRHPATLPQLLGSYSEERLPEALLLRLLLVSDLPLEMMERFGRLLGKLAGTRFSYHLLYRYAFWRGVRHALSDRESWDRVTHATPMLMYHAFGGPGEPASRFVLPIDRFESQMAWLKRSGYRVISLLEFLHHRREGRLPPARSIVITIDDGYEDNWSLAYPVLRRHGFPATIFLVAGSMGSSNGWDAGMSLTGRPTISWRQARKMMEGGVEFGAHTRSHPNLTAIPLERARREIEGSKLDLERELRVPVRTFSYPYGEKDPTLEVVAEQAGFWGSCGVREGRNSSATPLHDLRRVEVHGTDSLLQFALSASLGLRARSLWRRTARRPSRAS